MIFKNILHTTGTRVLNALLNLLILFLLTNLTGSKGFGIISLIILDVTIIQLIMGLLAGGSLIYFASRKPPFQLLLISYAWITLVTFFFLLVGWFFYLIFPNLFQQIVPQHYGHIILLLAWLNGFMQIHYNLLIGKNRITVYNQIFIFQIILLLLLFTGLLISHISVIPAYLSALTVSWGLAGISALYILLLKTKKQNSHNWQKGGLREMFNYGFTTQLSVILHLANKRISFYFLRIFSGLSSLGIYSAGVQLTEGLRIIGQSISLVQYSSISNSRNREYDIKLSIQLMKFSLILTLLALIILLFIPHSVYQLVFSKDFGVIKNIILILSPGVMALAANTIFSHYFSGTGQPKINVHANLTGLIFTITFAFILIPKYGFLGAAATASLNYSATVIYQYVIFYKETHVSWKVWIPKREDFLQFSTLFKQLFFNKKKSIR